MQHGLALMGHSVDIATAVAQNVQSLLYQNAQYLVSLCEVQHHYPLACIYIQDDLAMIAFT